MFKKMNFFEQQLWQQVGWRGRLREYGSIYFLLCVYNKKFGILAGSMPFTKDVCLFIALCKRVFSSL